MSTSLQLISENEYQSVPCTEQLQSFISLVGLRAPMFVPDDVQQRAGMDIVAVLDRSGSMAGDKMKYLHETVKLMIENLKDIDRLSLVSYDDRVETNLVLTNMTKEGKNQARAALAGIKDRGSTNLSGGLTMGLEIIKKREGPRNEVSSVLLLTDGLANQGITDSAALVQMTQRLLTTIECPVSLYSFGFGGDHDSKLLSALSQSAHGSYYFIKDTDSIPLAFADCLGGLMSVVAQNIKLTITAADGVLINSIATIFPTTEESPKQSFTVNIGDMFSEEERDILVDVTIPRVGAPTDSQPILSVQLKYLNVVSAATERSEVTSTIQRTAEGSPLGTTSVKVDQERNRIRTAQAMQQAMQFADQGNLQQAQQVLDQCEAAIKVSPSAAMSEQYLQDVISIKPRMQSAAVYQSEGQHRMRNKVQKHMNQRACETDDMEVQSYATNAKMATRTMWSAAFKK